MGCLSYPFAGDGDRHPVQYFKFEASAPTETTASKSAGSLPFLIAVSAFVQVLRCPSP